MARNVRKQAKKVEQELEAEVEANQPRLIHVGSGILLFILGAGITAIGLLAVNPPPFNPLGIDGGDDGGNGTGSPTSGPFPKAK